MQQYGAYLAQKPEVIEAERAAAEEREREFIAKSIGPTLPGESKPGELQASYNKPAKGLLPAPSKAETSSNIPPPKEPSSQPNPPSIPQSNPPLIPQPNPQIPPSVSPSLLGMPPMPNFAPSFVPMMPQIPNTQAPLFPPLPCIFSFLFYPFLIAQEPPAKRPKIDGLIPEEQFVAQIANPNISVSVILPKIEGKWNLNGQTLTFKLNVRDPVSKLKELIESQCGLPPNKQKLKSATPVSLFFSNFLGVLKHER